MTLKTSKKGCKNRDFRTFLITLFRKRATYNIGKWDKWTICITHSHFTLAQGRHDECYRTRTFCHKQGEKGEKVGNRIPAKEKGS